MDNRLKKELTLMQVIATTAGGLLHGWLNDILQDMNGSFWAL